MKLQSNILRIVTAAVMATTFAITLSSCAGGNGGSNDGSNGSNGSASIQPAATTNDNQLKGVRAGYVLLPDGTKVLCVSNHEVYVVSLSCNWAVVEPQ